MLHETCVAIVANCSLIVMGAGLEINADAIEATVAKHKAFVASQLMDPDPGIYSTALDAMATLDWASYEKQVKETLLLDIKDQHLLVAVGLSQLIGRAKEEELIRIREIVLNAAIERKKERQQDPFLINSTIVEYFAIEVLLASKNGDAVKFASAYLEEVIKDSEPRSITERELAYDLIGRYSLKALIGSIRTAPDDLVYDAALIALAKNGQQPARLELLKKVEAMDKAEYIISDSQLVDSLGITAQGLQKIFEAGGTRLRILAAGQLARLGDMKALRVVASEVEDKPDAEAEFWVEEMIGRYGDRQFVAVLDRMSANEKTTGGRLNIAKDIFMTIRRTQ